MVQMMLFTVNYTTGMLLQMLRDFVQQGGMLPLTQIGPL